MADFDLTQTDAQVQSILNDAQDAMGAGAQTTLTTEYIMLKGTNGRYHKILKDSFTEACRNVLASLLVNNDKGTTISQIAAIASNDFGSVTPANLASVLGGILTNINAKEISANTSLSSYLNTGFYVCKDAVTCATISDLPSDAVTTTGFNLINMSPYNDLAYGRQIFFQTDKIYIRKNSSTSANPNWGDWYIVGDTWRYARFITSGLLNNGKLEDLRTQNLFGIYGFSSTNLVPSDVPTGVQNGAVINFNLYADISIQILFNREGGMYSRMYWYGTWSSWA